jgi:hypothetical protein
MIAFRGSLNLRIRHGKRFDWTKLPIVAVVLRPQPRLP